MEKRMEREMEIGMEMGNGDGDENEEGTEIKNEHNTMNVQYSSNKIGSTVNGLY